MKAVILAGGLGTRLSEETEVRPKPMVEVGGKPILWHIMKTYMAYGVSDFIICLGYKGYVIKEYFSNYFLHMSDVTLNFATGDRIIHDNYSEPWSVTLLNTGDHSMTGGRLRRVRDYIGDEDFCFTYGDGVADIDLGALFAFHKAHGKLATMTAIQPPGRFGSIEIEGGAVKHFQEKPQGDGGWINGGFFVLNPKVIDYIDGDGCVWENEPLRQLVADDQLVAYQHRGFWQCMDTLRDKQNLENLWQSGKAPWKVWA